MRLIIHDTDIRSSQVAFIENGEGESDQVAGGERWRGQIRIERFAQSQVKESLLKACIKGVVGLARAACSHADVGQAVRDASRHTGSGVVGIGVGIVHKGIGTSAGLRDGRPIRLAIHEHEAVFGHWRFITKNDDIGRISHHLAFLPPVFPGRIEGGKVVCALFISHRGSQQQAGCIV